MCKKRGKSLRSKKRFLNSVSLIGTFAMNVTMEMTKMCFWCATFANFIPVMCTVMQACIIFFLKESGIVKNAKRCSKLVSEKSKNKQKRQSNNRKKSRRNLRTKKRSQFTQILILMMSKLMSRHRLMVE